MIIIMLSTLTHICKYTTTFTLLPSFFSVLCSTFSNSFTTRIKQKKYTLFSLKMNGLFLSNILHFSRFDQNEQVRFALFDLVNRSCSDLGMYDLSVQTAPSDYRSTVAFLHFDNWMFHAEAVNRLNGAHLSIPSSTTSLPVVARINRIQPPPGVAEAHRRNAIARSAALTRNADSTGSNRTLPPPSSHRQSRRTTDSTALAAVARPRPTSVKRLRRESSIGRDRASHSTAPSSRLSASSWAASRSTSPSPTTVATTDSVKAETSTQDSTPPPGQATAQPSESVDNDSLLQFCDDPIRCVSCIQLTTLRELARHRETCRGPPKCPSCTRTFWTEPRWSAYPCGHVLCYECAENDVCFVCILPGPSLALQFPF